MPKGDNFKKGGKNHIDPETAQERGRRGGKLGGQAKVPKGFAHVDVQAKAQMARQLNAEVEEDKKQDDEKTDSSL